MTEHDGVERSTATETFRAMLNERGVEWMPIAWNPKRETFYHTSNGVGFCADEYADGVKIYTDATITPEQAVEATLGRGTCHLIDTQFPTGDDSYFKACSGCGFWIHNRYNWENTRFCPHCGRRVVDE